MPTQTHIAKMAVVAPVNPLNGSSGLEDRILHLYSDISRKSDFVLFYPRSSDSDLPMRATTPPFVCIPFGRRHDFDDLLAAHALHPLRILTASRILHSLSLYKRLKEFDPDIIAVEFPYMFFVPKLYCLLHRRRILLSEHNVETLLIRRAGSRLSICLSLIERFAVKLSDTTICISGNDKAWLGALAPKKRIVVIANGVDSSTFSPLSQHIRDVGRNSLDLSVPTGLFHGSLDYPPNMEAALFLDREIVPLIRQKLPNFRMIISGRGASREEFQNSRYLGFTENLADLIGRCDVAIVPLRVGSGTKLKVLQYLSSGIPVVMSEIAAEGFGITNGNEAIVMGCDEASAYADAVVDILNDPVKTKRMSDSGRNLVLREFEWESQAARLTTLVMDVLRLESGSPSSN